MKKPTTIVLIVLLIIFVLIASLSTNTDSDGLPDNSAISFLPLILISVCIVGGVVYSNSTND